MDFTVMMTEDGHKISVFNDELLIDGKVPIHPNYGTDYKVIGVYVIDRTVLIFTDHPCFHSRTRIEDLMNLKEGNVFAVTTAGELLWKIEDLICEFKFPFHAGYAVDKGKYELESKVFNSALDMRHEYFVFHTFFDAHYLVDLTEGKFVSSAMYKS